jgi:hypothetical protein
MLFAKLSECVVTIGPVAEVRIIGNQPMADTVVTMACNGAPGVTEIVNDRGNNLRDTITRVIFIRYRPRFCLRRIALGVGVNWTANRNG